MKTANRHITKEDRKIRLNEYDLRSLRRKIMADTTDLNEKVGESLNELNEIVTRLYEKYVIDENLKKYYPGCIRLNVCASNCSICLSDIGFKVPKFNSTTDLLNMDTVSNYINITFTHPVIYPTTRKSLYSSGNFQEMVFSKMCDEDKELLFELIGNYVQRIINRASFLKEYRKPSKARWSSVSEFGIFTNLGQLYDRCPQYALIYKYDILGLEDLVDEQPRNKEEYLNNLIMDIRLNLTNID